MIIKFQLFENNNLLRHLSSIMKKPYIKLFRIIWIKDKNKIDTNNLGIHFVEHIYDFHAEMIDYLYLNATKNNNDLDEYDDCYLIEVKCPTNKIDIESTIQTNDDFEFESEIMLKDGKDLKIIKIIPFFE